MINVLVIVMEAITMWLCLHIAFGEKIKRTKGEVVFFIPYVVVCVLCAYELISKVFYLGLWVFVFVWCKVMFGQKVVGSFVRTALGVVLVGLIQMICIFVYSIFVSDANTSVGFECVIVCVITLILDIILYQIVITKYFIKIRLFVDNTILTLCVFIIIFFIFVKIEFEHNRTVPVVYVLFFVVIMIAFMYLCKKQRSIFELEKRTLNLELHSLYGNAYEDLLKEVRRRQHDYKNQLTAIYSMNTIANSLEELKSMQEHYVGIIERESEFDHILIKCNNPILAGYLYNMSIKCKNENVTLKTNVEILDNSIDVKTKDIIEILGVFITNAMEHIEAYECVDKIIYLDLFQLEDKIHIEIKNKSRYVSFDEYSRMFEKDYSTKGADRGIGLYSVKNIAQRHSECVHVKNVLMDNKNYIQFSVDI